MRIAVISDIHGNWEALQAVWESIVQQAVDHVYCLGDVVGYGANPSECLDFVQKHCQLILRGNHEAAVLDSALILNMNSAAAAAIAWTAGQLDAAARQTLATWPMVHVSAEARLVHASPHQPAEFHYILGQLDLEFAFRAFSESVCFFGHTHQPGWAEEIAPMVIRQHPARDFTPEPGTRYAINAGSVGQPRDRDPRARWVLVTDEPPKIAFLTVPYDIETAQRKICNAGLPRILADRLTLGQ